MLQESELKRLVFGFRIDYHFVDHVELVLPRSGLKTTDHPDQTDFGPDQTAQAVCGPKTE